ncbi:MAG: hypothetical protein IPK32_16335 [Verrucomicrobiaceae bacterium]|nr:hypothetical protein [Verrucomicrobiaceae bacterium]
MKNKFLPFILFGILGAFSGIEAQQPDKAAQAEIAKKYPSLRLQIKVGKRNKPVQGSSFMKIMTMTPEVVVESASTQPIAAMSATFLLITMETESKYRRGDELLTVATNESLEIPAVPKGVRRNFEFAPLESRYDSDRDATNVGGQVYKYYIAAVFADDKKLLHFETNCPELDKHLKAHPELREKFLAMKPEQTFRTRFQ